MITLSLKLLVASYCLLILMCLPNAWAFVNPAQTAKIDARSNFYHETIRGSTGKGVRPVHLFEDDDISPFNALCQFGPAPFFVRLTQSEKYWEAVDKFEQEERVSRVIAVRNMDAYFADPIGWGLKRERAKDFGEVVDYTKKTGIQKRPIFSLFMLCLTTWFFFSFLPTRVTELGGLKPSALEGGLCAPDVRVIDENGKQSFECKPKTFQDSVVADEKKYQKK